MTTHHRHRYEVATRNLTAAPVEECDPSRPPLHHQVNPPPRALLHHQAHNNNQPKPHSLQTLRLVGGDHNRLTTLRRHRQRQQLLLRNR